MGKGGAGASVLPRNSMNEMSSTFRYILHVLQTLLLTPPTWRMVRLNDAMKKTSPRGRT